MIRLINVSICVLFISVTGILVKADNAPSPSPKTTPVSPAKPPTTSSSPPITSPSKSPSSSPPSATPASSPSITSPPPATTPTAMPTPSQSPTATPPASSSPPAQSPATPSPAASSPPPMTPVGAPPVAEGPVGTPESSANIPSSSATPAESPAIFPSTSSPPMATPVGSSPESAEGPAVNDESGSKSGYEVGFVVLTASLVIGSAFVGDFISASAKNLADEEEEEPTYGQEEDEQNYGTQLKELQLQKLKTKESYSGSTMRLNKKGKAIVILLSMWKANAWRKLLPNLINDGDNIDGVWMDITLRAPPKRAEPLLSRWLRKEPKEVRVKTNGDDRGKNSVGGEQSRKDLIERNNEIRTIAPKGFRRGVVESVRRRYENDEVIEKNKTKEALESLEDRLMEYKDGKKRQRIQQEGNSNNTTLMIIDSNIEISAATNEQADRTQ
ncbi:hypothetical protein Gotur_002421 [Gossypium turneri]